MNIQALSKGIKYIYVRFLTHFWEQGGEKLNFDGLESFLAVVSNKSISKASRSLHITQPTLSTRIRKLEEELNIVLLERSWGGIELTKEGHFFLSYAVETIGNLRDASAALTGENRIDEDTLRIITESNNELRIGINIWLSPLFNQTIIRYFKKYYPETSFRFVTRPTNVLKQLMHYGGLHLSIHYHNAMEHSNQTIELLQDELVLFCHQDDKPILNGDYRNLGQLKKKYLLFENAVLTNNLSQINGTLKTLKPNDFQMVDDVQNMFSFIETGYGYTLLPKSVLSNLDKTRYPHVIAAEFENLNLSVPITMEYVNHGPFQHEVDGLIEAIKNYSMKAGNIKS